MDDAERIPIDVGVENAGEAASAPADARVIVRDDGSTVIDITMRPCEPTPSTEPEIVVCGAATEGGRLSPLPPPDSPNPMEVLAEAFSATVGPVEINPGLHPQGAVGIGLRIRF